MEFSRFTFHQSRDTERSKVGDRVVLYHKPSGRAMVLNPSGSLTWDLLEKHHTPSALADALTEQFVGIKHNQALSDVKAFLQEMDKHELIECRPL